MSRLIADRYRLEQRIGSGAMGVVWRGHDERLDRAVAVKQLLLPPGQTAKEAEESRARAMREGRIAARLQHPHAISVFDVALGVDDGQPWLVMEYLPSRSLATVLAEQGALPPREVARIGRQVADALAAAHSAGIVHRDVKPGNVLLGEDGTVKITDFGISRASWDVTVTRTGILAGTPAYFAPEVARGEHPSPASDVFSLGSTLYTAVEGTPPFGLDENTLALLRSVAEGNVRPPQQAGPLSELLMQLLRAEPGQRPPMVQARESLGAVAAGSGDEPARSATAVLPGPAPAWVGQRQPAGPPAVGTATQLDGVPAPARTPSHGPPPWWQQRAALLAAGVVLLAGLAGVAFATAGGEDQAPAAGPAPQSQAPAPAPTTTTAPSAPTTTVAPPPPAPPPVAPPVPATDPGALERTVRDYYGLLPENRDAAWEYLGPPVRDQAGGRSGYEQFWSNIADIRIVGPVELQGDAVLLNLRFDQAEGGTTFERYRLTMATAPDGRALIQTSESIGSFDPGGDRGGRGGHRGNGGDDDKGDGDDDGKGEGKGDGDG